MRVLMKLSLLALTVHAGTALAGSPVCNGPNETKLSWPAVDPVWEMCWLRPSVSSGPQGSGMELRDVHYRGISVLKTAHSPLLFAEYASSTCYRDWKDSNSNFVAEVGVRNQLGVPSVFTATTSCDRSDQPNTSYGSCPFQLPGMTSANCFQGLSIEDMGDHVVLSTHYDASWYAYTSRAVFYLDGAFDLRFGFGNYSNTSNGTSHWHHNYWRLDFDIDGPADNVLSINDVVQNVEFTSLRDPTGGPGGSERTWEVRNSQTNRGYRIIPSAEDYLTPTNDSNRGFHMTDVIGTAYVAGEYGDLANNPLGACAMNHGNLANGQSLGAPNGTDVVLYYRAGVKDTAGVDAMICKSAGPMFVPLGDWGQGGDPEQADLSIAVVSVPEPVDAGATVQFDVSIGNAGPQTVDEVEVSFDLPPELSLALGIERGGSTWACNQAGSVVTCELASGSIAAGAQSTFSITLDVDGDAPDGAVETAASVSSGQWPDPNTSNNAEMVTTTIVGAEEADLSIAVMSDPEPVSAGAVVQFHTTIANGGPRPVEQAQVEFDLPPELSLNSVRGATTSWSCQQLGGTVTCDMTAGSIGAKAQTLFIVALDVAKSAPDGKVQTAASVGSSQWPDPDTSNNTVLVSTTIEGLDLDTIFAHDFECREGAPGCPVR